MAQLPEVTRAPVGQALCWRAENRNSKDLWTSTKRAIFQKERQHCKMKESSFSSIVKVPFASLFRPVENSVGGFLLKFPLRMAVVFVVCLLAMESKLPLLP